MEQTCSAEDLGGCSGFVKDSVAQQSTVKEQPFDQSDPEALGQLQPVDVAALIKEAVDEPISDHREKRSDSYEWVSTIEDASGENRGGQDSVSPLKLSPASPSEEPPLMEQVGAGNEKPKSENDGGVVSSSEFDTMFKKPFTDTFELDLLPPSTYKPCHQSHTRPLGVDNLSMEEAIRLPPSIRHPSSSSSSILQIMKTTPKQDIQAGNATSTAGRQRENNSPTSGTSDLEKPLPPTPLSCEFVPTPYVSSENLEKAGMEQTVRSGHGLGTTSTNQRQHRMTSSIEHTGQELARKDREQLETAGSEHNTNRGRTEPTARSDRDGGGGGKGGNDVTNRPNPLSSIPTPRQLYREQVYREQYHRQQLDGHTDELAPRRDPTDYSSQTPTTDPDSGSKLKEVLGSCFNLCKDLALAVAVVCCCCCDVCGIDGVLTENA